MSPAARHGAQCADFDIYGAAGAGGRAAPRAGAQIVAGAAEARNVVACCTNEALRAVLPTLLEQLEMCQKSLAAYLETKRAEFPRFYFVSDPTLLEILSLGSDPAAVVPHFQSGLFDSLTAVTFDKARPPAQPRSLKRAPCARCGVSAPTRAGADRPQADKCRMLEMFSQQAEMVEFEKPVEAKGARRVPACDRVALYPAVAVPLSCKGTRFLHACVNTVHELTPAQLQAWWRRGCSGSWRACRAP